LGEKRNSTYDGLEDLYKEFGYYREQTISKTFDGVSGKDHMAGIMKEFREEGINKINGVKVVESLDYLNKTDTKDGQVSDTGLPKADALKFILEDGTWVAVRPSGTEPKMKFYIGITSDSEENAAKKLEGFAKVIETWE